MTPVIQIENVSKLYKLGFYGADTFRDEVLNFFARLRGKPAVNSIVGATNNLADKDTDSDLVWALKDINLTINQGDIVGIIGKNGAGKSTLLKILSKITTPTTGSIKIRGRIASLLEVGTGMHQELTGRENIFLNGAILGMTKHEIRSKLDEIIDFAGIAKYIDTPIKRYSSGMRVRLGFAIAAHLDPEILIVDEVLAVGDAEFQKRAIGKMQDISKGEGRTVLFVSHNMGSVRNLCKSGIVLENGTIAKIGTTDEAVDYYLQQKVDKLVTQRQIHDEKSLDTNIRVAFLTAEMEKQKSRYTTNEPIPFVFMLKANNLTEECRINCTISTLDGTPVGSISNTDFFKIETGEKKRVRLTLHNHNLAPGKYSIGFSVGIGNYITGQTDFDYATGGFVFEVDTYDKLDSSSKASVQWMKSWGGTMFPHTTEIL